jgi:signal peptidase I
MALSRLVYDNDHQAKDLAAKGKMYQRWLPDLDKKERTPWKATDPEQPKVFEHASHSGTEVGWLRYRHALRDSELDDKGNPRPQLITDFMGYNNFAATNHTPPKPNWVGDLILECEVKVDKAPEDREELWLELSRGPDRFQARFRLRTGEISLWRLEKNDFGGVRPKELTTSATARLRQPGTYQLRFANVDERLTLWVDGELPFREGQGEYDPPRYLGPDKDKSPETNNDLHPASIGVKGAGLTVSHLVLRRDTYYTLNGPAPDANLPNDVWDSWAKFSSNPAEWEPLRELKARTLYVQPGHYLCMGDNSTESSDSRDWGLVPERLLLGRALVVYYPFGRAGPIK